VTKFEQPMLQIWQIISKLENKNFEARKMVGQVKQRIQNWNQQATKFSKSYETHFEVRTTGTSRFSK
jgi:hypothetical protein